MDIRQQIATLQGLEQSFISQFGDPEGSEFSIHSQRSINFQSTILKTSGSNLDIIKNKLKLPFRDYKCPIAYSEPNNESAVQASEFVRTEIQRLLRNNKIIHSKAKPTCCNPLTVVSKLDAKGKVKNRLVLDLSRHINLHLDSPAAQLDDLNVIEKSLFKGAFLWSFDLKDQYHQIQIHEHFSQFLGFQFPDEAGEIQFYMYIVLPFGLNLAVALVTDIFKPFKAYLNSLNITNFIYIDDGLLVNSDKELLTAQIKFVLQVLKFSGWQINVEKTLLEPTQRLKHLGILVDTQELMYFSPLTRLEEIVNIIDLMLNSESIPARKIAGLLGKINSCNKSLGNICNIMSRRTQHVLGKYVNDFGWNTKVRLDFHAKKELQFFKDHIYQYNGQFISVSKTPLKVVTFQNKVETFSVDSKVLQSKAKYFVSDASDAAAFVYNLEKLDITLDYVFNKQEQSTSSSHRELLSILKFFELETEYLMQCDSGYIVWITDSSNLVLFLKQGSKNIHIQEDIFSIKKYEQKYNVKIYPVWTSRNSDLIKIADDGSRFSTSTDEWSVNYYAFDSIVRHFQLVPSVDCFSSGTNNFCDRFFSKVPQTGSAGVNFFCQNLSNSDILWICPPVKLIVPVVKHLESFAQMKGIMLVPLWRASSFYTYLFQGNFLHKIFTDIFIFKARFKSSNAASRNIFNSNSKFSVAAFSFDTSNITNKIIPINQLVQLKKN